MWAFDSQFDVTGDGRLVKLLYVVDEFIREVLAMEAERRIGAKKMVMCLTGSCVRAVATPSSCAARTGRR